MDEQLDRLMKNIAVKNGVILDKQDPLMVFNTIHAKLLEDIHIAQEQAQNQFKSQWEDIAHQQSEVMLTQGKTIIADGVNAGVKQSLVVVNEAMHRANAIIERSAAQSTADTKRSAEQAISTIDRLTSNIRVAVYMNVFCSVLVGLCTVLLMLKITGRF